MKLLTLSIASLAVLASSVEYDKYFLHPKAQKNYEVNKYEVKSYASKPALVEQKISENEYDYKKYLRVEQPKEKKVVEAEKAEEELEDIKQEIADIKDRVNKYKNDIELPAEKPQAPSEKVQVAPQETKKQQKPIVKPYQPIPEPVEQKVQEVPEVPEAEQEQSLGALKDVIANLGSNKEIDLSKINDAVKFVEEQEALKAKQPEIPEKQPVQQKPEEQVEQYVEQANPDPEEPEVPKIQQEIVKQEPAPVEQIQAQPSEKKAASLQNLFGKYGGKNVDIVKKYYNPNV